MLTALKHKKYAGVSLAVMAAALVFAPTAAAQTYTTTTTGTIDGNIACGTANLDRVINVPDSFTVTDVDVGFLASHSWRGDIRVDLIHGGVTRRIITSDTSNNASQDNYNVNLNDAAPDVIRGASHNTNDGLVAPPYENNVRPNNTLSNFNGQNANGNWTIRICDDFGGSDNGQFLRADLIFNSGAQADLNFALSSTPASPSQGSNITINAVIDNDGPVGATGVTGQVVLPAGLTFVSATGGATHSGGVVTWSVPGTLNNGSSNTISITANVADGNVQTVSGEITASDQSDPDSIAGNSSTTEDDDDTTIITPALPAEPNLTCAAPDLFDWDVVTWADGSTDNTYTYPGGPIRWQVSDPNSGLQPNPDGSGNPLPALSSYDSGGLVPEEMALLFLSDFANQSEEVVTTISVGTLGEGVNEAKFTIFDVDFAAGQFQDRIQVQGTLNGGATLTPTIVRGAANTVSGDTGTGVTGAPNNTDQGNLYVLFDQPVDTITVVYGSGSGAPANPGQQAISIHDVTTCERTTAILSAEKTNAIYDPMSIGLYALPGNDVIYTFSVENSGNGGTDADTVELIDVMPPEISFYNGDIDDGGPETDPVSFTQTGSPALTFNYATDVAFSNAVTKPANFAACGYTPVSGYDPAVTFICFNPKGVFENGSPDPEFTLSFRAKIK